MGGGRGGVSVGGEEREKEMKGKSGKERHICEGDRREVVEDGPGGKGGHEE